MGPSLRTLQLSSTIPWLIPELRAVEFYSQGLANLISRAYLDFSGFLSGMELHCRKSALTFLKVCLGGVANLNGNIGGEGVGIGQLSSVLLTHVDPALRRPEKEQIKVGVARSKSKSCFAESSLVGCLSVKREVEPNRQR